MNLDVHLPSHARSTIDRFLRAEAGPAASDGAIVALSGGIDSALVARLARDALGPERVLAVLLPDDAYPPALLEETREYADALGVERCEVPIGPIEAAVRSVLPAPVDRTTAGNVKARARMLLLYTLARERGRRVVGTGNKSEILLGYFTKYGDGGVDLLPIGDLYKTQVRALAAELDLPARIRERVPTAGFWEGQTDEGEIGLSYDLLDRILLGLEQLAPVETIAAAAGTDPETVRRVDARVRANRHKRRTPPIPKVGLRTVGLDWRD